MRTPIDHVSLHASRLSAVRYWIRDHKIGLRSMNRHQIRRCAKDLGLSSTIVQDAVQHFQTFNGARNG